MVGVSLHPEARRVAVDAGAGEWLIPQRADVEHEHRVKISGELGERGRLREGVVDRGHKAKLAPGALRQFRHQRGEIIHLALANRAETVCQLNAHHEVGKARVLRFVLQVAPCFVRLFLPVDAVRFVQFQCGIAIQREHRLSADIVRAGDFRPVVNLPEAVKPLHRARAEFARRFAEDMQPRGRDAGFGLLAWCGRGGGVDGGGGVGLSGEGVRGLWFGDCFVWRGGRGGLNDINITIAATVTAITTVARITARFHRHIKKRNLILRPQQVGLAQRGRVFGGFLVLRPRAIAPGDAPVERASEEHAKRG